MTTTAAVASETSADGHPARRTHLITGVPGRLLLAVVSGVLLYLSFPPRPLWWLAPLAFVGLGLVLHGRRARAGFGYGLVFGLAFFLPHLIWIEDFLGADFGSAPWLALSALQATFLAIGCAAMTVVARLPGGPAWMAALFVGFEWLRGSFPLNGFPWGRVAFGQPDGVYTSLASIGGAPLVSFALVLTGLGLAGLIAGSGRTRIVASACAIVPVLAGLAVWPTVGTEPTAGTRTVAIVQGNAPNIGLGLLGARAEIRGNHLAESERLLSAIDSGTVDRPDLVVWPETATAVSGKDAQLDALVRRFGADALIGALYVREDGSAENAVIAWDQETGPGERYAKRELVPFAEYVPWRPVARLFTPFLDNTADMLWGSRPGVVDVAQTRIGLAICYEAAYDYVARETVRDGAELLVVPTNNAWYGPGEMSYQQLAMSRLRAVEHGRAVVVPATSGVSAIVEPDGSVTERTDLFTAESVVADVALSNETTVATVIGAWPERVIVAAGLLALLYSIGSRFVPARRRSSETGGDA